MSDTNCPSCHLPVSENFFFCPNCGKKIKEAPIVMSLGKQIGIYALSILLPPLGLWPGLRYIRQKDEKIKTVGTVAIILTLISIIINVWISIGIFSQVSKNINTQLQQYQAPGL